MLSFVSAFVARVGLGSRLQSEHALRAQTHAQTHATSRPTATAKPPTPNTVFVWMRVSCAEADAEVVSSVGGSCEAFQWRHEE